MSYAGGEGALASGATPERELLKALRAVAGAPALRFASKPQRMTGGFWAETLAVRLEGGPPELNAEVVIRVMPDADAATREIVVQREVVRQGFLAPRVLLSGGAGEGLGRPFVVMERIRGRPPIPEVHGTAALAALGRAAARLPGLLAETSARLHVLDPAPLRSKLEALDGGVVDVTDLLSLLAGRATAVERPDLAGAATGMLRTKPISEREAICHGDLHPFNLLVDGERVYVVDWTVSLVADPAFDLAFTALTMAAAPIAVPRSLRRTVRAVARQGSQRFLRRYRRLAPHAEASLADETLEWYTGVHCLRALVEVADWIQAGTIDTKTGHPWLVMAPQMAVHLGALVGEEIRPM